MGENNSRNSAIWTGLKVAPEAFFEKLIGKCMNRTLPFIGVSSDRCDVVVDILSGSERTALSYVCLDFL